MLFSCRFNETIHTPLPDVGKGTRLTFSLYYRCGSDKIAVNNAAGGGTSSSGSCNTAEKEDAEVELGSGACLCTASDHALVRRVDLKDLGNDKKAHITLSVFYFNAPMEMVDDKGALLLLSLLHIIIIIAYYFCICFM